MTRPNQSSLTLGIKKKLACDEDAEREGERREERSEDTERLEPRMKIERKKRIE